MLELEKNHGFCNPEKKVHKELRRLKIKYGNIKHEKALQVAWSFVEKHQLDFIPKNLFLRARDQDKKIRFFLVMVDPRAGKVNLKQLASELKVKDLLFSSEEELKSILGLVPGEVTPFALIRDSAKKAEVIPVIDQGVFYTYPTLSFHPLRNDMTTTISTTDLDILLTEHNYNLLKTSIVYSR